MVVVQRNMEKVRVLLIHREACYPLNHVQIDPGHASEHSVLQNTTSQLWKGE